MSTRCASKFCSTSLSANPVAGMNTLPSYREEARSVFSFRFFEKKKCREMVQYVRHLDDWADAEVRHQVGTEEFVTSVRTDTRIANIPDFGTLQQVVWVIRSRNGSGSKADHSTRIWSQPSRAFWNPGASLSARRALRSAPGCDDRHAVSLLHCSLLSE